jgi:hypothetical protein
MGDRETFEIMAEPRGESYEALLTIARRVASTFSLVWRNQLRFDRSSGEIREKLAPDLTREEEASEWPGTTIYGATASVCHYALSQRSVEILREAEGLYSWLAPKRPEDLAFYRKGKCWLASVAHEHEAWVYPEVLPPLDFEHLRSQMDGRVRGKGRPDDARRKK